MVRVGLTFDDYVELKLKPGAGADRVFHEAAELERREMFPNGADRRVEPPSVARLRLPTGDA